MIINSFKSVIYLILLYSILHPANWESITSNLNITDIVVEGNIIYSTTNGGVIIIDRDLGTLDILDFDDDIYPLDLKSIYINSNQNIFLGSNGPIPSIQLLDNDYSSINTVFLDGIEGITEINQIMEFNGNIYAIASGSELDRFIEFRFDQNQNLYYQAVINNLPLQGISSIYEIDINSQNELFITTNKGVIKGIIVDSEVDWSIYNEIDLEKSFFINGSIFNDMFKEESVVNIQGILGSEEFNIATSRTLYNVSDLDTIEIFESPYELADFSDIYRTNDLIVFSITNMGIYTLDRVGDTFVEDKLYIPETILQNKFTAITVTEDEDVIAICENGGVIISDLSIKNFVPYNKKRYYPVDNYLDNYINISNFDQDRLFYGFSRNYRSGLQSPLSVIESDWNSIYFTNSGITPDLENTYNSPLVEIDLDNYQSTNYGIGDDIIDGMDGIVNTDSENTNYMVLNYLNKDKNGNLWVLNPYSEHHNNIVAIQTHDKSWYHLKDPYGLDVNVENNSLLPTSFDFGPDNRAWFSFRNYSNQNDEVVSSGGIKILDYNNTIDNPLDDEWLELENSDILPQGGNTNIWSLVFSKYLNEDILWILTNSGVKGYIVKGLELIEYPQTFYQNIYFDEFDRLKVDSQNNLWIITRHSGVRIIAQDTSPWPDSEGITTQNSPILSDIVYDIAFNKDNGKVYFATEKGISILQSPFTKEPDNQADNEILLSPNPFKISNNDLLSIWNLFPGSKVRIITLNGIVLKTFQLSDNENKINNWNGIMDDGNHISSGVYLITSSHPDYQSRISKLAVIR